MLRKIFLGFGILFIFLLGYSLFTVSIQEKPRKWVYTFGEYSREPFGTRIFFNEIDSLFPNKVAERLKYEDLNTYFLEDESLDTITYDSLTTLIPGYPEDSIWYYHDNFNYILINSYFNTNTSSSNALINHVFYGGHVQLYAYDFSFLLKERLGLKIAQSPKNEDTIPNLNMELITNWKNDTFQVRRTFRNSYFEEYPEAVVILENDSGQAKGIQIYLGYGSLTLVTIPHIFTNFDMLRGNRNLQETLISDLPIENTFWSSELTENLSKGNGNKDLLYFVFSHPTLKWGYYLLIFSLLIFFLLSLQRKQRAIPIVESPKNLTLSFLQTISDLHFARVNYKEMLRKKMIFLQHKIKLEYHLNDKLIDETYINQLAKRSKIKAESIQRLYKFYSELMKKEKITNVEFKIMCKLFQLFKK